MCFKVVKVKCIEKTKFYYILQQQKLFIFNTTQKKQKSNNLFSLIFFKKYLICIQSDTEEFTYKFYKAENKSIVFIHKMHLY